MGDNAVCQFMIFKKVLIKYWNYFKEKNNNAEMNACWTKPKSNYIINSKEKK